MNSSMAFVTNSFKRKRDKKITENVYIGDIVKDFVANRTILTKEYGMPSSYLLSIFNDYSKEKYNTEPIQSSRFNALLLELYPQVSHKRMAAGCIFIGIRFHEEDICNIHFPPKQPPISRTEYHRNYYQENRDKISKQRSARYYRRKEQQRILNENMQNPSHLIGENPHYIDNWMVRYQDVLYNMERPKTEQGMLDFKEGMENRIQLVLNLIDELDSHEFSDTYAWVIARIKRHLLGHINFRIKCTDKALDKLAKSKLPKPVKLDIRDVITVLDEPADIEIKRYNPILYPVQYVTQPPENYMKGDRSHRRSYVRYCGHLKDLIETDGKKLRERLHGEGIIDPLDYTLKAHLAKYLPLHYELLKKDDLGPREARRLLVKVFNIREIEANEKKIQYLVDELDNCRFSEW